MVGGVFTLRIPRSHGVRLRLTELQQRLRGDDDDFGVSAESEDSKSAATRKRVQGAGKPKRFKVCYLFLEISSQG